MAYLSPALRRALERAIQQARAAAKEGAADALRRLRVVEPRCPAQFSEAQTQIRNRLRAHARALGDALIDGTQAIDRLTEQAAYVQWHRLLFARFLLERRLLRHPEDGGDLTLLDCREEASALGLADEWAAAAHYTARLLPGVFPPDDPVEAISLSPEHARALRQYLLSLDAEMFAAEDTLGWTYQFWRSQEKAEINASGRKIGAAELPAVTQLFTEPYMVRFLLHNTLGAWWAGKVLEKRPQLAEAAADEASLRYACSAAGYAFDMLRFVKEGDRWRPAAGVFPGWPRDARAVTVLDPCCGSGHFLTEALAILVALRQAEEGLSAPEAAAAVLRDNLFGLEIDGRCVQIAAFAVALAAWRLGSWQALPVPHLAWSGAPPPLPRAEFVALANGDVDLARALGAIHELFRRAPLLGSLIEPTGGDLVDPVRVARLDERLDAVIERARAAEPERAEGAIAARGMADAATLLHRRYTLVATNVPFLGRAEQSGELAAIIYKQFNVSRQCLSTTMLERITSLVANGGSFATVTKQEWSFLVTYTDFRRWLLRSLRLDFLIFLGEEAWVTFNKRGPLATLTSWSNLRPKPSDCHYAIDATQLEGIQEKTTHIMYGNLVVLNQDRQIQNPDSRLTADERADIALLSNYAHAYQGISTGDVNRFRRCFWEIIDIDTDWAYFRSTVSSNIYFGGCENIVHWGRDGEHFAALRGEACYRKLGIAVSQMRHLPVSTYLGERFDGNVAAVIPYNGADFAPILEYCLSDEYKRELKKIDKKKNITNATLVKVPFDLARWQKVAAEKYPNGLPEPYSDDPTQWLFHGHPRYAEPGTQLHVALARLAGYRWPAEADTEMRLSAEARTRIAEAGILPAADADGLLALVPSPSERPLADRLRDYLVATFGAEWSDALERRLLAEADKVVDKRPARDGSLEAWLRDRAFRQHCALFHQRPFLWHVWDGQADGFAAFLHYHRLTRGNLEKLTFSLLGDWIARMRDAGDNRRLEAAQILQEKLQAILRGDSPHDIFVRWKPQVALPVGWGPDLEDGVRLNIRPFVRAGILRDAPNIHWRKDLGNEPKSASLYDKFNGERINDHTLTLAEKQAAREAAAGRVAELLQKIG